MLEKPCLMLTTAVLLAVALIGSVDARELTYGSWTPPRDAFNTKTLPAVFEQIKQDTKRQHHLEADRRRSAARRSRHGARA